jgi:hypothetical protein
MSKRPHLLHTTSYKHIPDHMVIVQLRTYSDNSERQLVAFLDKEANDALTQAMNAVFVLHGEAEAKRITLDLIQTYFSHWY